MYLVWETDSWYRTEVCDVLSGMVDEADQKTFILTSRPDQPRLLSPVSSPSSYPGFFLTVSPPSSYPGFFLTVSPPSSYPGSSPQSLLPALIPVSSSQSLTSPFSVSSAESLLSVSLPAPSPAPSPAPPPVPPSRSLHDSAHHYRSVLVIPEIHRAAGGNLTR